MSAATDTGDPGPGAVGSPIAPAAERRRVRRVTLAGRRSAELGCARCGQIASPTAARRGACTSCGGELVAIHEPPPDLVRDYLYRPISLRAYRRPDRAEGRTVP